MSEDQRLLVPAPACTADAVLLSPRTALQFAQTTSFARVRASRLKLVSRRRNAAWLVGIAASSSALLAFVLSSALGAFSNLALVPIAVLYGATFKRAHTLHSAMIAALHVGDIVGAARSGEQLFASWALSRAAGPGAIATWAHVQFCLGRTNHAIDLLVEVSRFNRLDRKAKREATFWEVHTTLPLAYLVVGDLSAADASLRRAEATLFADESVYLLAVEIFGHCRRGDLRDAVRLVDTLSPAIEARLGSSARLNIRLMETFAREQLLDGGYRSSDERIDAALDSVREAPTGAFDYLAIHWPALGDFLVRHNL